jgi:hypothetical protein
MGYFGKDRTTTIPLNERPDLNDKDELVELVHMIDFARNNKRLHEQLWQLHATGPLWDGDVISKTDRNELLQIGACGKVCVKGEDGFNACTYFGRSLLHVFDWLYGKLPKH